MQRPQDKDIQEYVRGTNALMDTMIEQGEQVWIINGQAGRRPVSATSREDAINIYMAYPTKQGSLIGW